MKKLFAFILFVSPALLFAQQKTANLTILSEDGDRFYLILNGEKQNNMAQSKLRLEELPQPFYNTRIVFEDSAIASLSRNNLMLANADNVMMDVIYKIKRDKTGKPVLTYYSAIEAQEDFVPPAGLHVYHYGRPAIVQVSTGSALTNMTSKN